jgi:hypothetical protein
MPDLDTRIAVLEAEMEALTKALDGRVTSEWVKDFAQPLKEAIARMETSMADLGHKAASLFDTHKEMMKKDEARKEEEWKKKTMGYQLKRVAGFASAVGAIWFVFRIAGSLIEVWMAAKGMKIP